ncbi:oxidoreductase [Oxalobacteraceae bacterium OM1]|nr:oxidoreductase [Oxalobacteraceae bacterium OM1]
MSARPLADPKPEPPRQPELEECCGSGCSPCVFDRYEEAMERYRDALRAWEARQASPARRRAKTSSGTKRGK